MDRNMIYVLDSQGNPLMPTKRHGKVRRWLKSGQAKVLKRKPFTIQLLFETTSYTQPITLGCDSGYNHIGLSAVTETKEVFSAEIQLLQGMKERLQERAMYRRIRRSRLRYRKPRFDNRKRIEGWLAPSLQHKLDSHILIIERVKAVLPISNVIVEVANFDTQKIINPDIKRVEYQEGVQKNFFNLREYILHRDNHQCQNPNCKNKSKNPILCVHHIIFRSNSGTDNPNNLITLCTKCHNPQAHKTWLKGWKPKVKSLKEATFMSMIRWRLVNTLQCEHTYGYQTKSKRIEHRMEKSHMNDAFVMAGGSHQTRCQPFEVIQVRRNNRSLATFYDAKYVDIRDKKVKSGQELFCGRTRRNKNLNTENLWQYRGYKVKKGRVSLRTERATYQPKDLVRYEGMVYRVVGSQNKGQYVKLEGLKKVPSVKKVEIVSYGKGFCFL
jgi:hypothetical protein